MHDAALAEMKAGKLAVRIGKRIRNRARRFRPTAPDLGERVFKAADHIDAYPVFITRDRIEDRFAARFNKAGNDQARPPSIDVDLEIDLAENRLMDLHERRGEHVENRCSRLGILTTQNPEQRLPLRSIGPLVDDDRGLTPALVNGTRPFEDRRNLEAVESRTPVMAGIDLHADYRPAGSVRGQSVELAGTAVGAIAIGKFTRLDRPLDFSHCRLPLLTTGRAPETVGTIA